MVFWVPIVLLLFLYVPARKAAVIALVGSWLFLPEIGFPINLLPDYDKATATSLAIILGALLLDPSGRIYKFRPRWIDIPMIIWCTMPFATSIANGLGPYDGASASVEATVVYGLPWLIGRVFFQSVDDVKLLAMGILIGGLIYVPLCLFEVRMSPKLHLLLYGVQPYTDFNMARRWGGFRPTVFMSHGLAVGVWMATAASMALWFWISKMKRDLWGVPMWAWFIVLAITTVLVKSTGSILILIMMMGLVFTMQWFRTRAFVLLLMISMATYFALRVTDVLPVLQFSEWLMTINKERGGSVDFRMRNEVLMVAHALERPILGWGLWGRATDLMVEGRYYKATPDSMWILMFGRYGLLGLICFYGTLLLPVFLVFKKMKVREIFDPKLAAVPGVAFVTLVYSIDGLFNAMYNPVFTVACGAVGSMVILMKRGPAKQFKQVQQAGRRQPRPVESMQDVGGPRPDMLKQPEPQP
jgi:hypothetical protein